MNKKLSSEIEAYYKDIGPDAWFNGEVPFEISSNVYLANTYAQLIVAYMQDNQAKQCCILETGAGFGQFSFYLLKALELKFKPLNWQLNKIKYIITDLVAGNIDYIRCEPIFSPYIKSGIVDFATYNAEANNDIELQIAKQNLSEISQDKLLITISNYLLDSIDTHAFQIKNKQLQSIHIVCDEARTKSNEHKFKYSKSPCENNIAYPNDLALQAIVDNYINKFDNATFLIPKGGFNLFRHLKAQSKAKHLLFIAGDKGYTNSDEFKDDSSNPHISSHSTMSFMVNFDAIAQYFANEQGCSLLNNSTDNYSFNVTCFSNQKLEDIPNLAYQYKNTVSHLGTNDVYTFIYKDDNEFHSYLLKKMESVLFVLNLLHWDPNAFMQLSDELIKFSDDLDICEHATLLRGLKQVEYYFYQHKNSPDVYYELARVYYNMYEHQESIRLYELSMKHFGVNDDVLYGLATNYFANENFSKTEELLNKALTINPHSKLVKELRKDLGKVKNKV